MYFRDIYLLISFFFSCVKSFQANWAFHFNLMIISFYLVKIIVNQLQAINIKNDYKYRKEL